MKPADVPAITAASTPLIDGDAVLFALSRPDLETDSYTSQIFRFAGGELERISHGWSDSALQHAPGSFGLLRSSEPGRPAQLHVGPHPGAVRRVSDFHAGVSEFALRSDGAQAVVVARIPEKGRYGTDPTITAAAEEPRRITASTYLHNGLGYFRDRPAQAFLVDLAEPGLSTSGLLGSAEVPAAVPLAWPGADVSDPQFRPESGQVSVIADIQHPDQTSDLRTTVWLLEGQQARPLDLRVEGSAGLDVRAHRWIDEHRLALVAAELVERPTDFVAQLPGLFVHDIRSATTRRLTSADDVELTAPLVIAGDTAYAVLTEDGAERIAAIEVTEGTQPQQLDRAELTVLTPADHVVTGFAVAGGQIAWAAQSPSATAAVFSADLGSGAVQPKQLGTASPLHAITTPTAVHADAGGGEVHGWLAVPEGPGPFPVILNIHGGPFAQYTHGLFDETQVLTEAGYAVVYANPRGSAGRGRAWGKAVQGDFASPAAADVLAVLDAALAAEERLDSTRMGVQGGSYGGYLTSMIIGSDHRFRAAIIERGYLVPHSFTGTSDIGTFFSEEYTGSDPDRIRAQSPLRAVKSATTPALVMHSELDLRCPLEQGQQMYLALQRAGVEAEMLIFPGENHELSRSGRPRHRVQRFEAILDWWQRHLSERV